MLTLPIPMIVSILLAWLAVRASLRENPQNGLLLLIGLCALQGLIIALLHHYGWANLRWLQPLTASLIPPVFWLVFISTTRRSLKMPLDASHAALPAATAFCLLVIPAALDIVVPLAFLFYGGKLLAATSHDGDSLPAMRLESGELPAADETLEAEDSISEGQTQRDATIMRQLNRLMKDEQLFLDANLTLTRLARKLSTPAKQVSAAINRQAGENVSRHVNRYRIDHACTLLLEGKSVTQSVYDSGFNTKSNFNREFQRLKLASPSDWLTS